MATIKRTKSVKKLNLSEHTLDINTRKCSYEKFKFSDIEDYVRAITGNREYQYEAIKHSMVYLWGGGYKNVSELAKENFKKKSQLQDRFGTEEILLGHLPLHDRISGVVHMATGTGKSYVIFAVAYLSIVMGLTKRVLVLGPSSTIIEEGLREKFQEFKDKSEWNSCLPQEYQGKPVELLTNNDAIEDGSITIENINAIYTEGGIRDTLFKGADEVLVLSDEIHHAYSHLNFNKIKKSFELDQEVDPNKGKSSEEKDERLWMQFLKNNKEITRHIGFTGTPYNKDDYFADVIFDYNIRTAINEKFIKDINPIIRTETDEGEMQWSSDRRFEIVLSEHLKNKTKYSYKSKVKPITVFYCPTQSNAQKRSEEFIRFLSKWEREKNRALGSDVELEQIARKKVICVISNAAASEYKKELDNIEETNPANIGGKVEFIFSVGKLLEGWDVDNVFQIVPMEEKVFNSKLLISQVLGRGLRIPRKLEWHELATNYPVLSVTNHDKFANHIKELMDAVTNSDMYLSSEPLKELDKEDWRGRYHFSLFNLNYLSGARLEDTDPSEQGELPLRELVLIKYDVDEKVTIERLKGTDQFVLKKKTITIDSTVDALHRRFITREYEGIRFDFGQGEQHRCPTEDEIRTTIIDAMEKAEIPHNGLTEENRKQIDLFFNQFLPRGKKKRVFENIKGDVYSISTKNLEKSSIRVGELERDGTAFLSESYEEENDERTKAAIQYLLETREIIKQEKESGASQLSFDYVDPSGLLNRHSNYVRPLVEGDDRPPYLVNPYVLKSPQSGVFVSHYPEKEFVFMLLESSEYLDSWIKSPDKGFYSIDYEYWRGGKDRVRRGFNPDFFIKIDLDHYIEVLKKKSKIQYIDALRELQERGYHTLIRSVEIKSDDDDDRATPAKAEAARVHFESLNKKLLEPLPPDFDKTYRDEVKQYYTFDLLKPGGYTRWFDGLRSGNIKSNCES